MKAHLGSGGNYICIAQLVKNPTAIQETWVQSPGWENPLEKGKASSVQLLSWVQLFVIPWTTAHQAPHPSPTPGVYPNSCPLSRWCHPTISSSVVPFSSCPQSFPASGSFQISQLFPSGGQSNGVLASDLLMNIQDWYPSGLTGLTFLQSKGLSWVFSTLQFKSLNMSKYCLSVDERVYFTQWHCTSSCSPEHSTETWTRKGLLFI